MNLESPRRQASGREPTLIGKTYDELVTSPMQLKILDWIEGESKLNLCVHHSLLSDVDTVWPDGQVPAALKIPHCNGLCD